MCEVLVNLLGSGILRDLQPTAGRERALVEVDRHGIVGQVCVVYAVAGDVLVLCPLRAELRHLGESQRELVGRRHEHGDPPTCGELDERLLGLLECCVVSANRLVAAAHEDVDGLGGGDPHGDVDGRRRSDRYRPHARHLADDGEGSRLVGEVVLSQPGEVHGHESVVEKRCGFLGRNELRLDVESGRAEGLAHLPLRPATGVAGDERAGVLGAGLRSLLGVSHEVLPASCDVTRPALEAPAGAEQSRRVIEREPRRLDEHVART